MFDIGATYRFVLIEGTSEGWGENDFTDTVIDIDGPLLKLSSGRIINSHSSLFVSATLISMIASASSAEEQVEETEALA
ncbi:hypothetical protein ASE04_22490 [Rhizobium sp. Root708]|uniref:hypothetical protein n=1 Tax=Rhizobium sp. Root708 TaxID=1736592 RepID=UPI0006F41AA4|nr:hypothetical protein [Rhizobium sp. Root708]KRB61142.1 hypothetical protein ASE04_22490 [Rhizobium sp. Root708]